MHAVMGSGRLIAGRYRLQGQIGRGAMGIVWRGRDELLARDVAVKEVQITARASAAEAENIYQRTLREARAAARLSHPAVVTVFDVVEEDGSPWIVMELVHARSLDRVIIERGPLTPLQAAELGATLVGALASAHAAGVLHRDVKPSNVLVTDDGRVVLTDFGIAKFAEDPGNTQAGMVVGTPGFTAPERVRGGAATPASDLWSLGATLYAAVEGRGPFDRLGGATAISARVATQDAPQAPSAGPLGPVIDALLSRDPGTRPNATTAALLLAESATAAREDARSPWPDAVPGQIIRDAPPTATTLAATTEAPGSTDPRVPFLDPPVFAALSMPDPAAPGAGPLLGGQQAGYGPVLWEPLKPSARGSGSNRAVDGNAGTSPGGSGSGPGSSGAGTGGSGTGGSGTGGPGTGGSGSGSSGGGSGTGGSDGDDWLGFRWRGGAAGPASARWKMLVAAAGVAAIALTAFVVWGIYSRSPSSQAIISPVVLGPGSAQHSPSPSSQQSGSTPAAGLPAPTPSTGASSANAGNPGAIPPNATRSPRSSSPSPSRSPSPSKTPTKTPTPTPTKTPTKTPTPTPTPTTKKPTPTPTPTTKKPTPTPTPTTKKPTPTPTPTTKKPSASASATASRSPSTSPKTT
jgi:tRNA A-37 threonylcarbamoyl transferase component Bud32